MPRQRAGNGESRARGPGSLGFGSPTRSATYPHSPQAGAGVFTVAAASDGAGQARWFGATPYSLIPPDRPSAFGQPSGYSLTRDQLAAHVRSLRRAGWQSWEIRTRFDFGSAA